MRFVLNLNFPAFEGDILIKKKQDCCERSKKQYFILLNDELNITRMQIYSETYKPTLHGNL